MALKINNTLIVPTYAEAFSMRYTRLVVTAINLRWLRAAVNEFAGYGTSVIGCDAEVGVEQWLSSDQTIDGRCGASLLAFGFSTESLGKAMIKRTGQCLMTCPTTAVFDGMAKPQPESNPLDPGSENPKATVETLETIELGSKLRFFGDGYQKSKLLQGRRFWRIPVMDGEFIVEQSLGVEKGIGGGNLLIQAVDQTTGLAAAELAIELLEKQSGIITPFPGGVVRSGSKVGSRYKGLIASTADAYCPTLVGRVDSELQPNVNCVYEIVIDGVNFAVISEALKKAIYAACGEGVIAISAGNYGGKLGKHHFHLHEILS